MNRKSVYGDWGSCIFLSLSQIKSSGQSATKLFITSLNYFELLFRFSLFFSIRKSKGFFFSVQKIKWIKREGKKTDFRWSLIFKKKKVSRKVRKWFPSSIPFLSNWPSGSFSGKSSDVKSFILHVFQERDYLIWFADDLCNKRDVEVRKSLFLSKNLRLGENSRSGMLDQHVGPWICSHFK